jgi:protocatechuate 3,4-dioxygenase beta subunit
MKLIVACVVILGASLAASAQPARQPQPGARGNQVPPRDARNAQPAPRGTGVLRGVVAAADTGTALRRAQVRVSGAGIPARVATTDAQGRWELRDLPAGRYTINASKAGFVSLQYGQRRPLESGTPLDLAEGQVVDKIAIMLPRGSVISGRLSDEFGEPVANATVTAMRFGYAAGARRLLPGVGQNARDTTDDQGYFRLFGLSPGEYVVSAMLRAVVMAEMDALDPSGATPGYAPTYYPGTPNANEAQRITVGVGQEQNGVAFSLIATRLVRVTGAVLNSQGVALTSGVVMLGPPAGQFGGGMMPMSSGRIDGSGQFRIMNVAPGRYVAEVRTVRERGQAEAPTEYGRLDVVVGGEDLDGVVIMTVPGARVLGQVTTDTNVAPPFRAQQLQVAARGADPTQASPPAGGNARVNEDWSFELSNLFGARLFRVSAPQGWVLKEVTLNGQDVTDTPVELPPGQTVSGLQVVLTEKQTQLSGRVVDSRGSPVTDATVVVFPSDDARWLYQSRFVRAARVDQQGNFQLRGLPPYDRYLVVAVQAIEDGQAGDPAFLESIRAQGVALRLGEGEVKAIDVKVSNR